MHDLTLNQQYELEKTAKCGKKSTALLALLFPAAAYWKMGKKGRAISNLMTLNWLFINHLVLPFRVGGMIERARMKLDIAEDRRVSKRESTYNRAD